MDERFDAVLFDLYGTLVSEEGEAATGARELLASLPEGRWAVVTSCPQRMAQALVKHAGLPASLIVSSDDVPANKPAPDGYLLAARLLGVNPEACLVVEDSAAGVAAAQAARMQVVSVREVALGDLAFEPDESGRLLWLRR